MAKLPEKNTVDVKYEVKKIFGIEYASYFRVGNLEIVKVLGFPIYKRVGDVSIMRIFGIPVFKRVRNISVVLNVNWVLTDAA